MQTNHVSKREGHAWEERKCNLDRHVIPLSALTEKAIIWQQQQPKLLSH